MYTYIGLGNRALYEEARSLDPTAYTASNRDKWPHTDCRHASFTLALTLIASTTSLTLLNLLRLYTRPHVARRHE